MAKPGPVSFEASVTALCGAEFFVLALRALVVATGGGVVLRTRAGASCQTGVWWSWLDCIPLPWLLEPAERRSNPPPLDAGQHRSGHEPGGA